MRSADVRRALVRCLVARGSRHTATHEMADHLALPLKYPHSHSPHRAQQSQRGTLVRGTRYTRSRMALFSGRHFVMVACKWPFGPLINRCLARSHRLGHIRHFDFLRDFLDEPAVLPANEDKYIMCIDGRPGSRALRCLVSADLPDVSTDASLMP